MVWILLFNKSFGNPYTHPVIKSDRVFYFPIWWNGRRAGLRNQWAKARVSSSLTIGTQLCGGIGRHGRLKISCLWACRFESCQSYMKYSRITINGEVYHRFIFPGGRIEVIHESVIDSFPELKYLIGE